VICRAALQVTTEDRHRDTGNVNVAHDTLLKRHRVAVPAVLIGGDLHRRGHGDDGRAIGSAAPALRGDQQGEAQLNGADR